MLTRKRTTSYNTCNK